VALSDVKFLPDNGLMNEPKLVAALYNYLRVDGAEKNVRIHLRHNGDGLI
jgi:hypothetical protein